MTFTSVRRGVTSLHGLSRQYSTRPGKGKGKGKGKGPSSSLKSSSSSSIPSHTTLPPAKLRALIALYHQADSWVTPENLAEKINQAFVPPRVQGESLDPAFTSTEGRIGVTDLEKARYNMEVAPKMAQWDRNQGVSTTGQATWGLTASKRELKVIEALYGVNTTKDGSLLPGLPVVDETSTTLDRGDTIFEKESQGYR